MLSKESTKILRDALDVEIYEYNDDKSRAERMRHGIKRVLQAEGVDDLSPNTCISALCREVEIQENTARDGLVKTFSFNIWNRQYIVRHGDGDGCVHCGLLLDIALEHYNEL